MSMMKFKSLFISAITAASMYAAGANALVYRIILDYDPDIDDGGTLSGFFDINTTLAGDAIQSDGAGFAGKIAIPNWITAIDLTVVEDGVSTNKTLNDFSFVKWNLTTAATGNFDITADFEPQFDGFGFQSSDDMFFLGNDTKIQQVGNELEFTLASTTTTPGEIPLLGLGVLVFYYKKLKNKNYKL